MEEYQLADCSALANLAKLFRKSLCRESLFRECSSRLELFQALWPREFLDFAGSSQVRYRLGAELLRPALERFQPVALRFQREVWQFQREVWRFQPAVWLYRRVESRYCLEVSRLRREA